MLKTWITRVGLVACMTIGCACGSRPDAKDAIALVAAEEATTAQPTTAQPSSASNDRRITIGERFSIDSKILGEARAYWVSLPASYGTHSTPQHYPVLYLLDGGAHFQSAGGVVQFMSSGINGNRQVPEMIVVAILNTDRSRDMTPTSSNLGLGGREKEFLKNSGGADTFLQFIREELFREIDSKYRTLPHRTIVGHSFGGLLALHALLERPEMFQAYIAIDPSLWWDDSVLVKRAKERLANQEQRKGFVYISLANNPDIGISDPQVNIDAGRSFAGMLAENAPATFHSKLQYFEGEDHGSVPLLSLYHGLLSVFDGYKLSLDDVIADPSIVKLRYEELSKRLGIPLLAPESLVDRMGAFLLDEVNQVDKAKRLFAINLSNYPDSPNAKWRLKMLTAAGKSGIEVEPKILAEYVGLYEFSPGFHIEVRFENGKLVGQATNQSAIELFAESESKFFIKVVNAQISFVRSADGKVTNMILHQNGVEQPAPKVK